MTPARALGALVLVATSGGCRLVAELIETDTADADADPDADAGVDVDATTACEAWSFAPAYVDPCELPAPGGGLVLGDGAWTFDTNSGALTDPDQDATFPVSALLAQAGGPELRVISVDRFELAAGATLRVTGKRPLVVAAWSTATIAGTLDATSVLGAPAAGADPDACDASPATAGTDDVEGAGGGGGGGLGADGAAGGTGNDGLAAAGSGALADLTVLGLRGGCAGAAGGNPLAGTGGPGGGAIHLLARAEVTVEGAITAGGAGGGGSRGGRSGGGGGGSGGRIGLEAPSIVLGPDAIVAANGGGGGGGSDGSPALAGQNGQPGATAATGGGGQGMGAGGGAGGARDAAGSPGTSARRGGGGGGGGVGIVELVGALDRAGTAIVSPEP